MIAALSIVGLALSAYALQVRVKIKSDGSYKPLCDINKNISCSKAFNSSYGSLARLPNPVYGILFYTSLLLPLPLAYAHYMAWIAAIVSLYLAYISYVKQRNFCLVCTAIYIINLLLLFFSWQI